MFSSPVSGPRHPAPAFGLSFGLHAALLVLLAFVPVSLAPRPAPSALPRVAFLVAPPPARPPRATPRVTLPRIPRALVFELPRRLRSPVPEPVAAALIRIEAPRAPAMPLAPPKPAVGPGVFASVASVPATASKPALAIRTGVFEPAAAPAAAAQPPHTTVNTGTFEIASAGSDWSAPAKSGRVAATGFDSSYAGAGPAAQPPRQTEIRSGGFSPLVVAESTAAPKPKPRGEVAPDSTIEVLFKPQPAYTAQARQLRIEGDALLEALFLASGEVRVERVIRGLGHGLDEKAIEAAEHIRFKPARKNGQPVDCAAIVHITFQLAY